MYVYIIYVQVWVSDQGFTDESYKDELTARAEIPVVIRPVNDRYIYIYIYIQKERERERGGGGAEIKATTSFLKFIYIHVYRPEIKATTSVLKFAQAQYCHVDFILERRNDITGLGCRV
jgi:hypothetical protein